MADTIDINIGDTGGGVAADVPRELVVPLQTIADAASSMAAMNKRLGAPAAGGGMESAFLRDAVRQLGRITAGPSGRVRVPGAAPGMAAGGGVAGFAARLGIGIGQTVFRATGAVLGAVAGSFREEFLQSAGILGKIMLADRMGVPRQGVIAGMPLRSRFMTRENFQAQNPDFFVRMRRAIGALRSGITGSLDLGTGLIDTFLGLGGMGFKSGAPTTQPSIGEPSGPSPFTYRRDIKEVERLQKRLDENAESRRRQKEIDRNTVLDERGRVIGPSFEIDYGDPEINESRRRNEEINRQRSSGEPISSLRTQDHYADWMNQPTLEVAPVILPTHWPSVELYIT